MAMTKRVMERVQAGLRRLLPILEQQRARDVSEADTVTVVKDLLADVFGYDKYAELTSEFQIRSTYCDLAIRCDGKIVKLLEVKAIGTALDDRHVRQAVDYAANQGVEWVILTNAVVWRLYQVVFAKPIDKRLLLELDLTQIDPRREASVEPLFLFCKEGFARGAHLELRDRQDATSRFLLGALVLHNETVLGAIRRELRRVVDVLVDEGELRRALADTVVKRDVQDGPEAEQALRRVVRAVAPKKSRPADERDAGAASSPQQAAPEPPRDAPAS